MPPPFFPALTFGWAFFGTLLGILVAAAWVDLKKMVVPKWLTLPALGLGLAFNMVRGGALGLESSTVWVLAGNGPLVGAVDGALFAVAGFATAFAVFFGIWLLGICGGGDVKLCAAVGAWIGPALIFRLFVVTIVMVALFILARAVVAAFSGNLKPMRPSERASKGTRERPRRRLLAFSPPLALATAVVLLWTFRGELHLLPVAAPSPESTARVR